MARKKGKRKGRSNKGFKKQQARKTELKRLILTVVLIVLSAMLFTAAFSGLATRIFSQTKQIAPPTPNSDERYVFHNQVRESVYTVAQGHKEGEELYRLLIDHGVDVYITEDGVWRRQG